MIPNGSPKRILYLAPTLPFPPSTGGQRRSFNFLNYLSSQGNVTLVSPGDSSYDREALIELKPYCKDVVLVNSKDFGPHSKNGKRMSIFERIKKTIKKEPWVLRDFISEEFKSTLFCLGLESFDFIFVRYPMLAYYFFTEKRFAPFLSRIVVDVDDVLVKMQERRAQSMASGYAKWRHGLEVSFLKQFYRVIIGKNWDNDYCIYKN